MHVGMDWKEYMEERQAEMNKVQAQAEAAAMEEEGHICCCCTGECAGSFDIMWQTVEFPIWLNTYATPVNLARLGVPYDNRTAGSGELNEVVLKDFFKHTPSEE